MNFSIGTKLTKRIVSTPYINRWLIFAFDIIISCFATAGTYALSCYIFHKTYQSNVLFQIGLFSLFASAIGFLLFIVGVMIIGTVPAVIIFEILWCRFYEKLSWKSTIIALIFCLILVLPVFTWWLQIDFPVGLIGNLILGY